MADLLEALPRRARRDALRALRGSVLRTELYALDGTRARRTVRTPSPRACHGVREEAAAGCRTTAERLRIFFPHALAQRTTQWERGDDPDDAVRVHRRLRCVRPAALADAASPCPRGWRLPRRRLRRGEPYLATRMPRRPTRSRDDAQRYIVDRVARTHQLRDPQRRLADVFALQASIAGRSAPRRIIGQTLNFYDGAGLRRACPSASSATTAR